MYNSEFVVCARKGSPKFLDTKDFFTCFEAPRGRHSEKPEVFSETLRRVTGGRRLAMFARRSIEGFDVWGNEAPDNQATYLEYGHGLDSAVEPVREEAEIEVAAYEAKYEEVTSTPLKE